MVKSSWLSVLLRIAAAWVGALFLAASACAEELTVPGSGNPEHVLGELARAFNARQAQHRVVVPPSSGTAGAVRDVSEGIAALGRVGRPLKDAELARGLTYLPLGRDAVAVAAGAGVTVRGISVGQVAAVFGGKVTDWSRLGGKPGPIRVIGKEGTDAVRQQLGKLIPDLTFGDAVKVVHLDTQLIELLDRYPTSFAAMNRSALDACRSKVVVLALDGVEPSLENLENGRYPLWLELGLIHRASGLSPAGKAFLEFIRSAEGMRILRAHGVLPLTTAR